MPGHQLPVNPRHNILVLIEEGNIAAGHTGSRHRNPAHQDPVANQHNTRAPQPLSTRGGPTDRTAPPSGSRLLYAAKRRRCADRRMEKSGKPLTTMPSRNRMARTPKDVPGQFCARVAAVCNRASVENTIDTPTTKRNVGKTRSVAVNPFHEAWRICFHAPAPPVLFTMLMKAMVTPRSTSSESSRFEAEPLPLRADSRPGLVAGFIVVAIFAMHTYPTRTEAFSPSPSLMSAVHEPQPTVLGRPLEPQLLSWERPTLVHSAFRDFPQSFCHPPEASSARFPALYPA